MKNSKGLVAICIALATFLSACRKPAPFSEQWQQNPTIQRDTEMPGQKPDLELTKIYDNRPEYIRRADNPDYNPDSNIIRDTLNWMFGGEGGGQSGPIQIDAPPPGADNIDIYDIKSGKVNASGGMVDPNDPDIVALRQSADQTGNEFGTKRFLLEQRDYARDRSNQLVDELNRKQIDPFSKEIEQKLNALNGQVDAAIAGHNTSVTQVLSQTPENQNNPKADGYQFKTAPYSANGQKVRAAQASVNYAKGVVAQMSGDAKRRGEAAVECAQYAVQAADQAYAEGNQELGEFAIGIATTVVDVGLGLIPGVGLAKDAIEAVTGRNLVTGEKLSTFERSMAVVGVLTAGVGSKLAVVGKVGVIANIMKTGAKDAEAINEVTKVASKAESIVTNAERIGMKGAQEIKSFGEVSERFGRSNEAIVEALETGKGKIGKEFESHLTEKLGGEPGFSMGGRDFDGKVGNAWYEAKSGEYWNKLDTPNQPTFEKFKSDMGSRLKIANDNGASYHLISNSPIRQDAKDFLIQKGITFIELAK